VWHLQLHTLLLKYNLFNSTALVARPWGRLCPAPLGSARL